MQLLARQWSVRAALSLSLSLSLFLINMDPEQTFGANRVGP